MRWFGPLGRSTTVTLVVLLTISCSSESRRTTTPTPVAHAPMASSVGTAPGGVPGGAPAGGGSTSALPPPGVSSATDVAFPPRNEPFDFRVQLEAKYRDGLRRPAGSSYVDMEGDIVWTQEYIRYRVNACDHASAVEKVLAQINGLGVQPVCGASTSGVVTFPPRNEPFAFRQALELTYRDQLRRPPSTTHVDLEGDIVWTQEYLRYRLNYCAHSESVQRVFAQIDGRGIQPTCAPPPPPAPPTPGPTPFPPGPTCSVATARCRDGELSCSRTCSGTCAGHGGVAQWFCPGPLCGCGS